MKSTAVTNVLSEEVFTFIKTGIQNSIKSKQQPYTVAALLQNEIRDSRTLENNTILHLPDFKILIKSIHEICSRNTFTGLKNRTYFIGKQYIFPIITLQFSKKKKYESVSRQVRKNRF